MNNGRRFDTVSCYTELERNEGKVRSLRTGVVCAQVKRGCRPILLGGRKRGTDDRAEEREKGDTIVVVGKVCVRVRGRRVQRKNVERVGCDLYS